MGSPPKHCWKSQDRELLAVLEKFYEVSNDEITRVFNSFREDELLREGLPGGLKAATILAQRNDIKHTIRGEGYRRILDFKSVESVRKEYGDLKDGIEDVARRLGIVLRLRATEYSALSTQLQAPSARLSDWATDSTTSRSSSREPEDDLDESPSKRRRVYRTPSPRKRSSSRRMRGLRDLQSESPGSDFSMPSSASSFDDSCSPGSYVPDSDSEDDQMMLGDNHFSSTASRIIPLLKIQFDSRGRPTQKHPRLLFRAFQPGLGLRGRSFQHVAGEIPPPPPYDSPAFRDIAHRHLCEDHSFNSPFLSWTENPARALGIIEKEASPRYLSVVDYNDYDDDLGARYGKGKGLWLVKQLCEDHGFDDLQKIGQDRASRHHGYTGTGEFISWASAESGIVGILDTATAKKLCTKLNAVENIDYHTGLVIGECLQDIRPIYREVLAYKLLRAFKIQGYQKGPRGVSYEDFVHGIYREPRGDRSDVAFVDTDYDDEEWSGIFEYPGSLPDDRVIAETHASVRTSREVHITVEIPTSRSSKQNQLAKAEDVSLISEEEHLQALVDRQLAEVGASFGVAVEAMSSNCREAVGDRFRESNSNTDETQHLRPRILADIVQAALTADRSRDQTQTPSQRSTAEASSQSSAEFVDLTDEPETPTKRHTKQSSRRRPNPSRTTLDMGVGRLKPGQSKTTTSHRPSATVENDDDIYLIENEEDDELVIVATVTRRSYMRSTRSVLTIRSRSLSERVTSNATQ